jgi:NodT family efflux transporter outer membrane factor (OMF) lipoprotein
MMRARGFAIATALLATACAVGPDYKKPSAPVPPAYKEALPPADAAAAATAQWKPAEPRDDASRGKWWELFEDPELNALEEQVNVSNQNIAQAEAQFRGARAAVRGARADFFPTVTASASATRSKGSAGISAAGNPTSAPTATTTVYALPVDLSYEVDVWGRVRRNVESSVANAQASAADLETVRLTMHAELALDYFQVRGTDTQRQLLDANVAAYEKALQMTMNRFNQGVVSGVDVAQAQTLLETTRAQATDLGVSRAQLEHAIATLIGKAPADFTFKPAPGLPGPPVIPVTMPSELLERRPDIAAAERRAAAANAQIGVATSAFFPSLLLSATGGYQSSRLADWFSLPSRLWSIGPALVTTIFDGGKRRAGVEQAQASYDAAVAVYRLDVLTSFQQVEDNLATLRILAEEATQQAAAVTAAERSLAIARNRYLAGTTTYLEVVTAQAIALSNERTAVDIQTRRMTAAVNLIKALGGGWRASDPPYGRTVTVSAPPDTAARPSSSVPSAEPR